MYEAIQKTRSSSNRKLVAHVAGLLEIKSMRGAFTIGIEAVCRYVGQPGPECNQKRRHINSPEADGRKRMDKSQQPKRSDERTITLWPNRKDKARKPLRLQPFCGHSLPAQLRHEKAGCVIGDLQDHRLYGGERQASIAPNNGQARYVETAKKIKFRCPVGGQSRITSSHWGTNSKFKNAKKCHFVPSGYKTPTFVIGDRPPTGHLYRLTIYTSNLLGVV